MSDTSTLRRERLDPDRWYKLKEILADALEEVTPAARSKVVTNRCADDTTLLAEAKSLLVEAEALLKDPTDSLEDCAEHATSKLWQEDKPRRGWRIGAYVVVRELGRGGMGAVYLASRADGQFKKEVAIKVLKRGTDTEEVLKRFASERHILAQLDHHNIAHLLDAGTTDDGLPYFVMEYVAGAPVTRYAREHDLSIAERLAIFLKICGAVEAAHQHHVIHRDLKPSNIFVNAAGEPKLLDFGIAKLLGPGKECLEITAEGEERLTPNCASPEQADGRPVTEASDVYALGALLYELLSEQKPHKFSTRHPPREEIVRVIREEEPPLPSSLIADHDRSRQVHGDLDAIVQFAMRKEPASRYHSVAELAADIRRHLAHEPVLARRGTSGYRAKSFLVRHRRGLRATAAASAIITLFAAVLLYQRAQRREALPPPEKSIAVLPFDNLGNNNPPSYFADGVQDNILTDLGKVGDLKVISRSGVAMYRGTNRDVKAIGRELGVANVLEGSVQIFGDRVRINAQLIDTRTDTQIWAEHYDRKIEDIFALQSDLAQTIAAQLKARLTSQEKDAISKRPTNNLEAYDLYLRARAALNRAGPFDPKKSWGDAVTLLNQAIALDPQFALAYCLLNEADVYIYRFGNEHPTTSLAAAKEAAETALRLQPDLEEGRVAMARYYYYGLHDYRQTMEQLALVPASKSHDAEFYTLASITERRLGRWADAVRDGEKAVALDPRNPHFAGNLVQTYAGLRRYADARTIAERAIRQLPRDATDRLWTLKGEAETAAADFDAARTSLENVLDKEGADYQVARLWLCVLQRDFATAQRVVTDANEDAEATPNFWVIIGTLRQLEGNADEARRAYLAARNLIESALQRRTDDADLLSQLAQADAGLGQLDDALREAQRALELARADVDAMTTPYCAARLAEILSARGERDEALRVLSENAKVPFGPGYGDLKFNPAWESLRDDSRFDELLKESRLAL